MQDFSKLKDYFRSKYTWDPQKIQISPLSGGFSNLTYLLNTPAGKYALRRPPVGNTVSKAHDMGREFKVLESLKNAGYTKIPNPVFFEENEEILGAPFFLMEFVEGTVLRNKVPSGVIFNEETARKLSENSILTLLQLHQLDLEKTGLIQLGKPQGYVLRQVEGWIERYFKAKTDEIPEMEKAALWIKENIPQRENTGFIHNDFKYDNLVLNTSQLDQIKAVLDWEMATVGDPLMDLGTTLAYWAEENDSDILKQFNLTHLPGNMTREEVIDFYGQHSELDLKDILFYYVFGLFKVAVIAQQIYKRFVQGYTQDQRFGALIYVVKAASQKAEKSIKTGKI
ncbi:phosphotransferase family protein [Algoriphagus mannitolivorans]|uniref:phosphotransferase family protein n=1 Tax=Algoriphagus mannitolivorans TaxID=226504 RepID=UPI0003F7576C|nr:phosphotransferase family protein [Algoriphagus mannitolivorans]